MQATWRNFLGAAILWAALGSYQAAQGQDWLVHPIQWEGDRVSASLSDEGEIAEPEFSDEDVEAAALWQPASTLSQPTQPGRAPAPSRSLGSRQRLASMPNMFGDFSMATATVRVQDNVGLNQFFTSQFDLPLGGGGRRTKIAENNNPLPADRVYFMYNHFENVFELRETQVQFFPIPSTITQSRPISLDRYTLGFEKTFLDGDASVQVRMPFNGAIDQQFTNSGLTGGNVGNLAVILKYLCYSSDNLLVSAGLGLDTPTGSNALVRNGTLNLSFQNDAFHVLPFAGVAFAPAERAFVMGFLQMDVTASGNEVIVRPDGQPAQSLGNFTEQNLLFADLSFGYWVYRNPYAERWTGVAAIGEFHYTTALQDTDNVLFASPFGFAAINNAANRFDVVNATAGIQVEMFNLSSLRVAGVFPLGERPDNRFFDSELQIQFNRRF